MLRTSISNPRTARVYIPVQPPIARRGRNEPPIPGGQMEQTNMAYTSKVEGSELVIRVDISKEAIDAASISKSAIAKAIEKKLPVPTAGTLVASSCGFQNAGKVKFSLNVTKA